MKRAIPIATMICVALCTIFLLFGITVMASNLPHSKSIGFPEGTRTALVKMAEGAEVRFEDGVVKVISGGAGTWGEPTYNWARLGLTFGIPFAFIVSVAMIQPILSLRRAIALGNCSVA